jgi:hypothetical protein
MLASAHAPQIKSAAFPEMLKLLQADLWESHVQQPGQALL